MAGKGGGLAMPMSPTNLVGNTIRNSVASTIDVEGRHLSPTLEHTTIHDNTGGDGRGLAAVGFRQHNAADQHHSGQPGGRHLNVTKLGLESSLQVGYHSHALRPAKASTPGR